jgi:hypothetical protein
MCHWPACAIFAVALSALASSPISGQTRNAGAAYLGFDSNDYPGDAALANLKGTFAFSGYWLNAPPGEKSDNWAGKRALLQKDGFGFLVLFNGRLDKKLKSPERAAVVGKADATDAVQDALREGFYKGAIIFLDQEEGGRLLPEQDAYLFAWIDGVIGAGFRAGVYCSGIASPDGGGRTITTAEDIRQNEGGRKIVFFVYNDVCPPSPGCARSATPPSPSTSGVSFASVWQFAQSPRRPQYTQACSSTYAKNGNCYPSQAAAATAVFLDLESAFSPDPSNTRK